MKAINFRDAVEANRRNPNPRLTIAALVAASMPLLFGDVVNAYANPVCAVSSSPAGQSLAVHAKQNAADDFLSGCDDEERDVIERAFAAYRSLHTYQDRFIVAKIRHDKEGDDKIKTSMVITCSFAKPNRIALIGPRESVVCDGQTCWHRLGPAKQYTERRAPERIDFDEWDLGMLTFRASHPIVWLLTREEDRSVRELLGFVKQITGITTEEFGGRPGKRIGGSLRMKYLPIEEPTVSFDAWFSDETGLVEEIRLDLTEAVKEIEGNEDDLGRFLFSLRFQNIKLDEQIGADHFLFEPQPGDTKTEEFELPAGPKQREMIGKRAPAFSSKAMAGTTLQLSDYSGQVVVLDFWATWCRACVPGLLGLQRLEEKYAGQSVSVIGINLDDVRSEKRVAGFLENRNITFPQAIDIGGDLSQAYRISSLPCTVLIDKEGIVRAIYLGVVPEKKLSLQIDRMLQYDTCQR